MSERRLGIIDGTPVYPETRFWQASEVLEQECADLLSVEVPEDRGL